MNTARREFLKMLFQKRTFIGWGFLFIVPFIITVAFRFSDAHTDGGGGADAAELLMSQLRDNGIYIVVGSLMVLMSFFLPLLAAMSGSYTIAGEAENGTLRTVLMQPVRRGSLLMAKWLVANFYVAIGMVLLGVAGLISGGAVFGLHPMRLLSGQTVGLGHSLGIIVASYAFVFLGMMVVVSLAVLLSTLANSSLTAVAGALVLVIVMTVLMSFSVFDFLKPYLFTSHFEAWMGLLKSPVDWDPIVKAIVNFLVWIVGTTGLGYLRFRRKDILS